jgi:hypothetical protein
MKVVAFTLWLFYSWEKRPQYQMERRLGGPHSWSQRSGKEKIPALARY